MNVPEPSKPHLFSTGFLDGVGSVMDLSGTGDYLMFEELQFQPTALFRGPQGVLPVLSEGFPGDREALIEDWQKVGSDMLEAMNEYRRSVGS